MISIIVAYTKNYAIGRNNQLLFHISADLKRFKALTTGNTVVMGRKTFESLPKGALPNRQNIVISHADNHFENTDSAHSLEEAIMLSKNDNIFIIGGGSIYKEAFDMADCLRITEINAVVEDADTFFPEVSEDEWEIVEASDWTTDEKSNVEYRFVDYRRK